MRRREGLSALQRWVDRAVPVGHLLVARRLPPVPLADGLDGTKEEVSLQSLSRSSHRTLSFPPTTGISLGSCLA